jgi:hypothetical protein
MLVLGFSLALAIILNLLPTELAINCRSGSGQGEPLGPPNRGKGPGSAKTPGPHTSVLGPQEVDFLGRTQSDKPLLVRRFRGSSAWAARERLVAQERVIEHRAVRRDLVFQQACKLGLEAPRLALPLRPIAGLNPQAQRSGARRKRIGER